MNIDVHCHIVPEECRDLRASDASGRALGMWIERDADGQEQLLVDGRPMNAARPEKLWDIDLRLREMDASGVDLQALSVPPFGYFYSLAARTAADFAGRLNDGIAAVVRGHPERFIGLATVPLQDTDLAVAELVRAVEQLGMRGVEISSNVAGENLDTARLRPFFARVEQLGVPIFIHPHAVAAADRLRDYYLTNLIGNPLDTSIAAARLIFGGVLERFPRLNVYLAHGGGNTPYICGRWQHGWEVRPEPKLLLQQPPMEFVRRFWFDTITHSQPALRYLVQTFGSDHVLLGTDYPFDMGDTHPVETVDALDLSPEERQQILGASAARLFGLSPAG
jgi:aminocarboxymuconate-semialdehyde decarboxylase